MPGKALAGVVALAIVAAGVGCGGSNSNSSTSASTEGLSSVASEGTGEIQRFREQVLEVQNRHKQQVAEATRRGGKPEPTRATQKNRGDSGGGASQFRSHGDNSVQEFGREATADERERAAAALHGYLDSEAARRWAAACGYMSASLLVTLERVASLSRRSPKPKGCPNVLAALSSGTARGAPREVASADVGSMRIEGDRSFLLYHGARRMDYAMPMVREAGEWKVASLAGAPLP